MRFYTRLPGPFWVSGTYRPGRTSMRAARMTSKIMFAPLTMKTDPNAIPRLVNSLADSQENDPRWLFKIKLGIVIVGLLIWVAFVIWLFATVFGSHASERCIPQTAYTRAHPTQYNYGNLCK